MKVVRKIIQIDDELCDGCGQCVPACAEGSLQIVDGKARVVSDNLCDGLGACIGDCPNGALRIVEREAEEFDEQAVVRHLAEKQGSPDGALQPNGAGCPSAGVQMFSPAAPSIHADGKTRHSALSHWPVKIRLVAPTAPFLKSAELLVLADCSAAAIPALHRDFIQDRVVLMGCPKFDDAEEYVQRFAAIFREAGIRRIVSVTMEVPCCSALPMMVKRAMALSGQNIPMEEIVIGRRGDVVSRAQTAGAA